MVSTSDGSLPSAVVPRGATDHGFETAVSMTAMAARRSSALSTARARASHRGGRTRARTGAAPDNSHNVCTGIHGRRSWSARAVRGELTGRTASAPGRSPLAFVERAQAANAADARDDGGDVDHDGEVGAARAEGHTDFAAAVSGDGAHAPSRTRGGGSEQEGKPAQSARAPPARSAAARDTARDARGETRRKRPIPHRGSAASSRRAPLTRP